MVAATMEWHYLKCLKFTGSTGKMFIIQFLESRSALGAKLSSVYNISTGASKYINILKNYYPSNIQNFPNCASYL